MPLSSMVFRRYANAVSPSCGAKILEPEIESFCDTRRERLERNVCLDRSNEIQWFGKVVFKYRVYEPLPCLDIPYEYVQIGVVAFGARQGAKVLSTITGFWWSCKVEDQEWAVVRLAHL